MGRKRSTTDKLTKIDITKSVPRNKLSDIEKYNLTFATNLRNYLIDNRISQKLLAENIGVSSQTISNICLGETDPSLEQIISISKSLNISVDYLLGLTTEKSIEYDFKVAAKTTGLTSETIKTLSASKEMTVVEITNGTRTEKTIDFSEAVNRFISETIGEIHCDLYDFNELCSKYNTAYNFLRGYVKPQKSEEDYSDYNDYVETAVDYYSELKSMYLNIDIMRIGIERKISKILDNYFEDIEKIEEMLPYYSLFDFNTEEED